MLILTFQRIVFNFEVKFIVVSIQNQKKNCSRKKMYVEKKYYQLFTNVYKEKCSSGITITLFNKSQDGLKKEFCLITFKVYC